MKLIGQKESSGKKDSQPKRNWSTLPRKFGPQSWGTLPSKKSTEGRNTLPRKFGSENWSKFVAKDGVGGQQLVQSDSLSGPVLPRRNSMSSQSSNLGRGSYQQVSWILIILIQCKLFIGEVQSHGTSVWRQPLEIAAEEH